MAKVGGGKGMHFSAITGIFNAFGFLAHKLSMSTSESNSIVPGFSIKDAIKRTFMSGIKKKVSVTSKDVVKTIAAVSTIKLTKSIVEMAQSSNAEQIKETLSQSASILKDVAASSTNYDTILSSMSSSLSYSSLELGASIMLAAAMLAAFSALVSLGLYLSKLFAFPIISGSIGGVDEEEENYETKQLEYKNRIIEEEFVYTRKSFSLSKMFHFRFYDIIKQNLYITATGVGLICMFFVYTLGCFHLSESLHAKNILFIIDVKKNIITLQEYLFIKTELAAPAVYIMVGNFFSTVFYIISGVVLDIHGYISAIITICMWIGVYVLTYILDWMFSEIFAYGNGVVSSVLRLVRSSVKSLVKATFVSFYAVCLSALFVVALRYVLLFNPDLRRPFEIVLDYFLSIINGVLLKSAAEMMNKQSN